LCFAGGEEGVVVIAGDVVGDTVGGFKCATMFGAGDLDGSVEPFF
jgi:hypothetical protein